MKKVHIATDVGGVIKEHKEFEGDLRWVPCARWGLCRLAKRYKLHIISHVKRENEARLKRILRESFVQDYIPESRWHFVYTRPDKIQVMKRCGISTLIDDREDIIDWVERAGLNGILFRSESFPDWCAVVRHLRSHVLSYDTKLENLENAEASKNFDKFVHTKDRETIQV